MSSVRVTVFVDMVAEEPEEFNLILNVPSALGPAITVGNIDRAVGIITDATSKCVDYIYAHNVLITVLLMCIGLVVEFRSGQFTGSESSRIIEVVVRITGGTSTTPITVTVTPSVQSPVSAMGM